MQVVARNHRQQRPDRREEEAEGEDPQQRGLKIGRVAHIAQARADGGRNPLRGQRRFEERDTLPVEQHPDDRGERDRVQQKDVALPVSVRLKAATIRPPSAGPTARRDCSRRRSARRCRHQLARDKFGHNRLPCWIVHRRTDVQQEGERQQRPRRMCREGEDGEDADRASIQHCQKISRRRRSKRSAVAPASSPRQSTGRLAAVCINANQQRRRRQRGHQPVPAVSCIQVPTLETVEQSSDCERSQCAAEQKPLRGSCGPVPCAAYGVSKGITSSVLMRDVRCAVRSQSSDCQPAMRQICYSTLLRRIAQLLHPLLRVSGVW